MTERTTSQSLVDVLSPELLGEFGGLRRALDAGSADIEPAIQQLGSLGLLGATIYSDALGRPATIREVLEVIRLVAQHCGVLGRVIVDANLGPTAMVAVLGTDAMREDLLASCRAGQKPAIAISERDAGSDVQAMRTVVRWAPDGAGRLIGEKVWITGAPRSTRYVVFAKSEEPDGSAGSNGDGVAVSPPASGQAPKEDIIVLYLPASRPGVSFGEVPLMMGMRGLPEGTVCFDGVEVTRGDVLIGADGLKGGMALYNTQRLGAAMVAVGVGEGALLAAMERLRTRRQFGRPIGEHQGMRFELARNLSDLVAARVLVEHVGENADGFALDPSLVAVAKLLASRAAKAAADFAIQAFGAEGYRVDRGIEALWRDVRMFEIGGGTREMLLDLIGRRALQGRSGLIPTFTDVHPPLP
jgi:alkylation response protein AidB-like acyl-CoA dehydrogenase